MPALDELGGGVARWVFFYQFIGEWRPYRDLGYADGSSGLIQRVEMPRESALKARLIVAASLLDVPSDPFASDLQCGWNIGDGRCDSTEVIVPLVNPGCIQSDSRFSVVVDSSVGRRQRRKARPTSFQGPRQYNAESDRVSGGHFTIDLTSASSFRLATPRTPLFLVAYRTVMSKLPPRNSACQRVTIFSAPRRGIRMMGVMKTYREWSYGKSVLLSVRVNHSFRGVAPGEITEGTGFRVYSSTWEVGSEGFVFIDDDVEDENPPLVYSGEIEPGGFVRVLADPFEVYAKDYSLVREPVGRQRRSRSQPVVAGPQGLFAWSRRFSSCD